MSNLDELKNFTGEIFIFPLPNVVLFPNVVVPLHIFEPRYRKMVEDAMDRDGLIGMGLLKRGWEEDYFGKPPIHDTICIGKIVDCDPLENGRYNILLKGICRAKVIEEIPSDPYRTAMVEPLEDQFSIQQDKLDDLVMSIVEQYRRFSIATAPEGAIDERPEVRFDLPPDVVSDLVASNLNLESHMRQTLLEEIRVDKRLQLLSQTLKMKNDLIEISKKIQPKIQHGFSLN